MDLTVEYTIPADAPEGWTPLHEAARHGCSDFIAVLLEREFADAANAKVDYPDLNLVQAVPLDLALSHARSRYKDWGGGKPAVGLIVALYQISMDCALEALELLAPKTNDIQQKFDRYKMDGKIVEVGLLLMAAHKQLLASSHLDGGLTADLYSLPSKNVKDTISSEMKVLLNIFDKVGDKLRAYRRLGNSFEDIAAILEDAGLSVTHKDAYTCYAFSRYVKDFQRFLMREEDHEGGLGLRPSRGAPKIPVKHGSSLGKPASVWIGDFQLSSDIKPLFIVKGDKIWSPAEESFASDEV